MFIFSLLRYGKLGGHCFELIIFLSWFCEGVVDRCILGLLLLLLVLEVKKD